MLAGGQSSRLRPYRTIMPKPLMPLGKGPAIDLALQQAAHQGFTDVTLAVGDLAPLIRAIYGDGASLGLSLTYTEEHDPLGGAAGDEPLLVLDGIILTALDLRGFLAGHVASGNLLTVATERREVEADFDAIDLRGSEVTGYVRRPRATYSAATGVYALQPEALAAGAPLDPPALLQRLIADGQRVGAHETSGLCLDLKRREDYEWALARYDELVSLFAAAAERPAA
jgi:NDP-mannose synthase